MSNPEETPDSESKAMPDGVPAPPSILPTPDEFVADGPEKISKREAKRREKKTGTKTPHRQLPTIEKE